MVTLMAVDQTGAGPGDGSAQGDGDGDASATPQTRFAQARGARLAYQDFGSGPAVVAVPPMAQNIEVAWEWPAIRSMLQRFGSFSRWVQFDKRGTGASDRKSRIPGLDERVDDLRAVMDEAGIQRAFIYGASEGGPMCVLFAATYPERVQGLILHGTTACFDKPGLTEQQKVERDRGTEHMADVWGTPNSVVPGLFVPSLAEDEAFLRWFERYERLSADQDSLRDLLRLLRGFDVRDLLAEIDVPTLILHRTGDRVIPVEEAELLAAAIPGAELVIQDGDDHFAFAGDMGWLDDLERFVSGTVKQRTEEQENGNRPIDAATRRVATITTLGRFSVSVDGVDVPTSAWGSRLPRQLCKRLVAARGWPVTREELFELLWPDESDVQKLGARLSVQLSTVRRVLNGAVIADRQTVALNLDEVATDLEAFHQAEDDRSIVDRYAGDFLVEDVAEDWSRPARDEARARFVNAANRLIERAVADGDHEQAAELARRCVAVDRYNEQAHRSLVLALLGAGLSGEARRAHQVWAEAMAELDVTVPQFEEL